MQPSAFRSSLLVLFLLIGSHTCEYYAHSIVLTRFDEHYRRSLTKYPTIKYPFKIGSRLFFLQQIQVRSQVLCFELVSKDADRYFQSVRGLRIGGHRSHPPQVISDNPGYDMLQVPSTNYILITGRSGKQAFLIKLHFLNSSLSFSRTESLLQTPTLETLCSLPGHQGKVFSGSLPQLWDVVSLSVLKQSSADTRFRSLVCVDGNTCFGLQTQTKMMHILDLTADRITDSVYQPAAARQYHQLGYFEALHSIVALDLISSTFTIQSLNTSASALVVSFSKDLKLSFNDPLKFQESAGKYYLLAGGQSNTLWTLAIPSSGCSSDIVAFKTKLPSSGEDSNDEQTVTAQFIDDSNSVVAGVQNTSRFYYFEKRDCHSSCLTCNGGNETDCLSCVDGFSIDLNRNLCLRAEVLQIPPKTLGCDNTHLKSDEEGINYDSQPEEVFPSDSVSPACRPTKHSDTDRPLSLTSWRLLPVCDGTCLTCSGPLNTDCLSCLPGNYLNVSVCAICDPSCVTCSGPLNTDCLSCLPGNYLNMTVCSLCDPSCLTCSGALSSECASCSPAFFLNLGTCTACDPSCGTCSDALTTGCLTCSSAYYTNAALCSACNPVCLTCVGPLINDCSSCLGTFALVAGYCCDLTCATCSGSSSSNCLTCPVSRFLSLGQCLLCYSFCLQCTGSASNACTSCPTHRFLSNGSCVLCHSSCGDCTGPKNDNCTSCTSGHLSQGICCHSNCETCSAPSSTSCLTCPVGRYLSTTSCLICDPTCNTCTGSTATDCSSCIPGRVVISGRCCNVSCGSCTGPLTTNCTTCNPNYYASGGLCLPCDVSCLGCTASLNSNCSLCATHYYNSAGTCLICDASCLNCSGPLAVDCTSCITHYFLNLGTCPVCDATCNDCNGALNTQCTSCVFHNYLDGAGQCSTCHIECGDCTGPLNTQCSTCPSHFYVSAGSCFPCHTTCDECSAGLVSNCTVCLTGKLVAGYCCDSSCTTCNGPLSSDCTACPSNSYTSGTSCPLCHSSCSTCNGPAISNCLSCSNSTLSAGYCCDASCGTCNGTAINQCTGCSGTFMLALGFCCHSSCLKCYEPLINNCDSCSTGFVLAAGYCCHSSCKTCNGPLTSNCLTCTAPAFLNGGYCCHSTCATCNGPLINTCISCTGPLVLLSGSCCDPTCATCSGTLVTNCTTCPIGFILSAGRCCHPSCVTCSGILNTNCVTCVIGKYVSLGTCLPCQPNCSACSLSANNCSTCVSGRPPVFLAPDTTCCHPECLTCSGTGNNQCLSCSPDRVLVGSFCFLCHSTCIYCTGLSSSECTSCSAGLYLQKIPPSSSSCVPCNMTLSEFPFGVDCLDRSKLTLSIPALQPNFDGILYQILLEKSPANTEDHPTVYEKVGATYQIQIDFRDTETGLIEPGILTKYYMKSLPGMILLYVTILTTPQKHNYTIELSSPTDTMVTGMHATYKPVLTSGAFPYVAYETAPLVNSAESKGGLFSNVGGSSATNNGSVMLAIATVIALDPTGMTLKFSQGIKLYGRLYYININYGKRLDIFLSRIGDMPKVGPNSVELLRMKNYRGKLSKHRLQLDFTENSKLQIYVYLGSWGVHLLHLILMRYVNLPKFYLYVLYYYSKIQIVIFNTVLIDFAFHIPNTLNHLARMSPKVFMITWMVFILLSIDFIGVVWFIFDDKVWERYYRKAILDETPISPQRDNAPQSTQNQGQLIAISPTTSPVLAALPLQEINQINYKNTYEEISTNYHLMELIGGSLVTNRLVFNSRLCRATYLVHLIRLCMYSVVVSSLQYNTGFGIMLLIAIELLKVVYILYLNGKYKLFRMKLSLIIEVFQSAFLAVFLILVFMLHFKRFNEVVVDGYQDAGIWIIIGSCVAEYLLLLTYIGIAAYDFFKNRKKRNLSRKANQDKLDWIKYGQQKQAVEQQDMDINTPSRVTFKRKTKKTPIIVVHVDKNKGQVMFKRSKISDSPKIKLEPSKYLKSTEVKVDKKHDAITLRKIPEGDQKPHLEANKEMPKDKLFHDPKKGGKLQLIGNKKDGVKGKHNAVLLFQDESKQKLPINSNKRGFPEMRRPGDQMKAVNFIES